MKCDYTNYCGVCQWLHEPNVSCAGEPIDWQARHERASAWVKRQRTMAQIAAYVGISKDATRKMLQRLAARDLIACERSGNDFVWVSL